jgi:hypothetical protein
MRVGALRLAAVSLAAFLPGLRTLPAAAQINPAGGEIAVGATATFQGLPAAASDLGGDFVVVWQKQSLTTGGWDIFARRYARSGWKSPRGGARPSRLPANRTTLGIARDTANAL